MPLQVAINHLSNPVFGAAIKNTYIFQSPILMMERGFVA